LFEICLIYNIYILETAINKIADGQLDYKLGEKMLLKPFAHSVNAVNHISDGLNEALKKQIQSEHFKTELITNVSHDIKTPLTSIMNYVGLLQQANVSGEEAKDYLEVLERQSGKLKKLIEDMIEASKASTGNLIINLAPIDAGMMVEQAVAEYSDRFLEKGLTVKYDMRSEYSYVLADGKYLWRAFDNLLVNIYKYTLENTRVYIDVEDYDDENCSITFKNISKYEIKLTPDELTERFVRGDKSRNTEGSGLGLSIARGIIESMNGKMYIDIDGDLYKVVVILSKASATQLTEE
jgi:signal transduction histidine kinase